MSVSSFFCTVTILYSWLLSLLTMATWQNFTPALGLASREATQLSVVNSELTG